MKKLHELDQETRDLIKNYCIELSRVWEKELFQANTAEEVFMNKGAMLGIAKFAEFLVEPAKAEAQEESKPS